MNNNKSIARNKAIYELLKKHKNDEELINGLSYGFVTDSIEDEFKNLYNKYLEETKNEVDSDYDKSLFSSWFYIQNNKILGEEKLGTGYINPIKTVGSIKDLEDIIPFELKSPQAIKRETKKMAQEMPKPEVAETEEEDVSYKKIAVPDKKELAIIKKIDEYQKTPKTEIDEILTIEKSLKIYSPNITEAEIKGFVYYKQKYGSPMIGWEKWFLPSTALRGRLAYATTGFSLKDQQFNDVKSVPSGTLLGVKTKFKNEYDGEIFWVIKSENKELYYASQNNFREEVSFATVDEVELDKLVQQKGLCFDGNDYIPVYMYTFGDIFELKEKFTGKYDRETDKFVDGYRQILVDKFGEETAKWQESLIENALKTKYNFDFSNPVVSERPYLSKENDLSYSFKIKDLDIDSGVSIKKHYDEMDNAKRRGKQINYDDDGMGSVSLFEAYEIWFGYNVNDNMLEKTKVADIQNLYFKNGNVYLSAESQEKSKKDQDKEKDERRILAKLEGDKFYSEFLATALVKNDLLALNMSFNKLFNNFVSYNLDKVPVGFEANNKIFNLDNFRLKPVQRNGLAFLNINNSGCLAYDVGFGKTLTAIHNLAMLLKQGSVKRPLIAVPKQVYKNWIYEMFGYWTNGMERDVNQFADSRFVNGALTGSKYKLNDWYNLRGKKAQENKEIPEYTITLVTYQGLETIGFSENLHSEMADDFFEILNVKKEKETARSIEKELEKNETLVGKALAKTELDIDVLGFDYLVFDEAHAFKNIFASFSIPENFRDSWRIGKGTQSSRALKAFTLSLYIQKKYNGNVNILTATPFTNSPMELYSMLSLVGYNYLVSSNINNLFKFLSLFIETQVEYTVDHLQNIVLNTVIKSFKNKNILRDILYGYFDYQDNPKDAGIKRPTKVNFPNHAVSTYLQMSDMQKMGQEMVVEEADNYSPDNKGAMGRALSWAKSNSFSPYLLPNIDKYDSLDEFMDESPKIKYTIECIKSVKEFHESLKQECSGQVIYSNRGKDLFPDFKRALEQECGFKKGVKFGGDSVDEVEIITSSTSDADADRKELIKDAFNEGFVKVIIGTATIQEGINLQKRGTILYHLDLDWNPTAFKQLEGRIHRQGNKFKYVRIVVPMVQDTLDSFINQKLDEKSKRIASIWDKDNQLNDYTVSDALDPMEIKFNLIKDEEKLFKMKLDINIEQAKKEFAVAEDKMESFSQLESSLKNFEYYKNKVLPDLEQQYKNYADYLQLIEKYVSEKDEEWQQNHKKGIGYLKNSIQETLNMYEDFSLKGEWKALFEFKRACTVRKFIYRTGTDYYDFEINYKNLSSKYNFTSYAYLNNVGEYQFNPFMDSYGKSKRLEKTILKPYGLTIFDDISNIKLEYENSFNKSKYALEFLNSEDYKDGVLHEIRMELDKRQMSIGSLQDRVDAFSETNNLLTYPFDDEDLDTNKLPIDESKEGIKFLKNELVLEDYIDTDNMDVKVSVNKLSKIKDFFNLNQLKEVQNNVDKYVFKINSLYKAIKETPLLKQKNEEMAYLHYYNESSNWYVLKMGKGDIFDDDFEIQKDAYIYLILNNNLETSEFGYSDINEIKKHAELDLEFTPMLLLDALNGKEENILQSEIQEALDKTSDVIKKETKIDENQEIEEAIDILHLLQDSASDEERQEIDEALEILEMLREEVPAFADGGSVSANSHTFGKTTIETPLDALN